MYGNHQTRLQQTLVEKSHLDSKTDVAVVISDGDKSLEPGPLSGASLLLDRHDLQHLILEGSAQKEIDDLELLRKSGCDTFGVCPLHIDGFRYNRL